MVRPLVLARLPLVSSVTCKIRSKKMSTKVEPVCPKFVPVEQSEITSVSKVDAFKISLISYNILAQAYVKSSLFPHSPSNCLKWKPRSQAILTVIKGLEADFLCLQELDEYDNFYKGNIENDGYSSIYVKRSGQKRDGCGIFYKQNKAELVIEEKIDYNDLVNFVQDGNTSNIGEHKLVIPSGSGDVASPDESKTKTKEEDRGDPNDPRVRLKRDCVGIMAAFKLKEPSQRLIIVANTHIYWDPEWADVKVAQVKYLLSRLAKFEEMISMKFECTPAVIVAGDFNSLPGDKVYQYLISGNTQAAPSHDLSEDLPIPLCSLYAYTRGEPEFTNCTPGFTGTLDYVFFSPSADINPVSYLELPDSKSSHVNGGLPNWFHPSDHLPIGAEFEIL